MLRILTCLLFLSPSFAYSKPVSYSLSDHNGHVVSFSDAYSFPTLSGTSTMAAFVEIQNHSEVPLNIVGANTNIAGITELHTHEKSDDGIIRMREVESITIPASETIALKPGGLHIMLMDVKESFKVGDTFTITLTFDGGRTSDIQVNIRKRS